MNMSRTVPERTHVVAAQILTAYWELWSQNSTSQKIVITATREYYQAQPKPQLAGLVLFSVNPGTHPILLYKSLFYKIYIVPISQDIFIFLC